MIITRSMLPPGTIVYPESDGKPMADNTQQARWIVTLYGNLCALFDQRDDVFVAADLLWYAVEGEPNVCQAPDVMVIVGRPKGDRGSYRQWLESDLPPTVVFEIQSPGNDATEMARKQAFYEEHGVNEYYLYDPDKNYLQIYLRRGSALLRQRELATFVSPHLGIRFQMTSPEMTVFGPTGEPFWTFEQLAERKRLSERALRETAQLLAQAQEERLLAQQQRLQAEQQRDEAQARALAAESELARLRALLKSETENNP